MKKTIGKHMFSEKLEALGFERIFPDKDDKDYFYWELNIKHKLLKGLQIIIDEYITVFCKQHTIEIGNIHQATAKYSVIVHFCKITEKNIDKVVLGFKPY